MSILDFTYAQVSSLNETEAQVYNYVMMNRDKVMDESIRDWHMIHMSLQQQLYDFVRRWDVQGS